MQIQGFAKSLAGFTTNLLSNYLKQASPGGAVTVGAITASEIPDLGAAYIRNGTALQAGSNFNISGNGLIGGNLGIGTPTAQRRLHVSGIGSDEAGGGDLRVTGTGGIGSAITLEATGSGGRSYSWISTASGAPPGGGVLAAYDSNSSEYRMVINSFGNVGIGTNTPTRKLTVMANEQGISQIDGGVEVGTYVGEGAGWIQTFSNHPLNFATNNGSAQMTLTTSGDVGIGTTTPTQRLQVNGNIFATGTITPSDRRYKQQVAAIPQALAKLTQMRGVSYQWKSAEYPKMGFSDRTQLGLIAQELKDVLPEAVHQDAQGMYSVNYTAVIPVLVEGMKEQQALIQTLQTEKDALAQRLAKLEQMLQQLSAAQAEKQHSPKQQ